MLIGWRRLITALALTVAVPLAHADDWADCRSDDPDVSIRGCSAIIASVASTKEKLGVAFNNRGAAFHMKGELDRAMEDLNQALVIDPEKATAYFNRGHVYLSKDDINAAITDYEQAIALRPEDASFHQSNCWLRAETGTDLEQARAACNAALALEDNPYTLHARGLVGINQGRFDEAWADYDAALKLNPEIASALYGRGVAALRLGRDAEGNADLAAATKLDGKIAEEYAGYGVRP